MMHFKNALFPKMGYFVFSEIDFLEKSPMRHFRWNIRFDS